jgi:uncharacterized membrane protein required for colicin V production
MIGLVIFVILLFAFYEGARRGTALQIIYTLGFFLSFLVARAYYQPIGERIELYVPYLSVSPETTMTMYTQEYSFDLGKAYYAGIAFIALVFVGWLLTKFIGILSSGLRFIEVFPKDWILSGTLNVIIAYTIIMMIFVLLTTIPIDFIQQQFEEGKIGRTIVEKTPVLSNLFEKLWFTDIIH